MQFNGTLEGLPVGPDDGFSPPLPFPLPPEPVPDPVVGDVDELTEAEGETEGVGTEAAIDPLLLPLLVLLALVGDTGEEEVKEGVEPDTVVEPEPEDDDVEEDSTVTVLSIEPFASDEDTDFLDSVEDGEGLSTSTAPSSNDWVTIG